jgi:hypothetical protein
MALGFQYANGMYCNLTPIPYKLVSTVENGSATAACGKEYYESRDQLTRSNRAVPHEYS